MKIDDIVEEIGKDSIIDHANLDRESIQIPLIHGKYYKIFIEELRVFKGYEKDYNILKRDQTEYYLGRSSDEVYKAHPLDMKIIKQDLDLYLDADDRLSTLKAKKDMQKAKVEMVEAFIKTLNNRGFQIKNAIDFMKFKNGGF
jgi:hypothetical protein